jgi:hypothetical protein
MPDVAIKPDFSVAFRELRAELKLLEQRMTVKFGAMIAVWVVIVIAAQKLL